jgi:hypothetical protein
MNSTPPYCQDAEQRPATQHSSASRDAPTPSAPVDIDKMVEIAAVLGKLSGPTKEWLVMDKGETSYRLSLNYDESANPARECQEHLDRSPHLKAQGYHVVERTVRNHSQQAAYDAAAILLAAAVELSAARAAIATKMPADSASGRAHDIER